MLRPLDLRLVRRDDRDDGVPPKTGECVQLLVHDGEQSRTVEGRKLLIGADGRCDVSLPGVEMPELHSIVHRDHHGVWLDVLINSPVARVNRSVAQWTRLHDGDEITIGDARITVRLVDSAVAAGQSSPLQEKPKSRPRSRTSSRPARFPSTAGSTALLQAALQRAIPDTPAAEDSVRPLIMPLSAAYAMSADKPASRRPDRSNELRSELETQCARLELLRRDLRDLCDAPSATGWNFLLAIDEMMDRLEELVSAANETREEGSAKNEFRRAA